MIYLDTSAAMKLVRPEKRSDDPNLRSLDAIHLATAEHIVSVTGRPLDALVTYDERLLAFAREAGLPVVAPGLV